MRLLFAEDEVELSDAVVAVLKHNKYSVDAVYNGQDAYDYLSAQEYDGAILDIMMPGLDGVEVVKRIRKEGNQESKVSIKVTRNVGYSLDYQPEK